MSKRVVISFFICVALAATFVPCFAGVSPNAKNFGFMKDSRDGQVYKTVKIGDQVWMAENLNYKTFESHCYPELDRECVDRMFSMDWFENGKGESPFDLCSIELDSNCTKYGRLYSWNAAMGIADSSCTESCDGCKSLEFVYPVQGVCPAGWHLPSKKEWKTLIKTVGGKDVTSQVLKSTTGWFECDDYERCYDSGNGSDDFGFAALPAGVIPSKNDFDDFGVSYGKGSIAHFWSSLERYHDGATNFQLASDARYSGFLTFNKKRDRLSVRCVKDRQEIKNDRQEETVSPVFVPGANSSHRVTPSNVTSTTISSSNVLAPVGEGSLTDSVFSVIPDSIGNLLDPRDGQTYRTVKIGSQTWMAENLNFKTRYSFCYDNDSSNCKKYGRLYVWNAAIEQCPAGWHLPDTTEWKTLLLSVGGKFERNGKFSDAGKVLKSTTDWQGGNGSDDFGFSALPAGNAEYEGSVGYGIDIIEEYGNKGFQTHFWSSTESKSYEAFCMMLDNGNSYSNLYGDASKDYAYSVRCVKDYIRRKNKDGRRTNDAVIPALSGNLLTDPRDGQTYKTVKIGLQTWMAENLRYNMNKSMCYNRDDNNCMKYGRFYEWLSAMNACPAGWHLPSGAEWDILFESVGGRTSAAKVLKSKTGWHTCKNWGWQNGNGTDDYGFSVFPEGAYCGLGGFVDLGLEASFWSSTAPDTSENGSAGYIKFLAKYNYAVYEGSCAKHCAFSVRCVRDEISRK